MARVWKLKWGPSKIMTVEGKLQEQIRVLTEELEEARRAMIEGRGLEAERGAPAGRATGSRAREAY